MNVENLQKYCTNTISSSLLDIFKFNSRIIVNGFSFSGKTRLCINLLKKYFYKIDKIIVADCPNHHEISNEKSIKSKVEILDHIPSISEIKANYVGHIVIILDDNYTKSFNSENVLSYFTAGRHNNISCILICQNMFFSQGKYSRDITLNASHIILLKMRDLTQIQILARQIFGKNYSNRILEIYKFIQKNYKWGHLLIDVSQSSTPDIELRSNIAIINEEDNFETCYKILN